MVTVAEKQKYEQRVQSTKTVAAIHQIPRGSPVQQRTQFVYVLMFGRIPEAQSWLAILTSMRMFVLLYFDIPDLQLSLNSGQISASQRTQEEEHEKSKSEVRAFHLHVEIVSN